MKKNTLALPIIILSIFTLTSCSSDVQYSSACWTDNNKTTYQRTYNDYFNTSITVAICSDTLTPGGYTSTFTEVENIIEKYDQITSKRVDYDGIVNVKTINDNPSETHIVSDELFEILEFSLDYYEISEGRFNIALDPVVSLWEDPLGKFANIGDEVFKPLDADINSALKYTDASKIRLNPENKSITMEDGMSLNLGGIAKGYMVDVIYDFLDSDDDVTSFMINAGGSSIRYGGHNPSDTRDYWTTIIQNPYGFDMLNYYCYFESTSNTDCYYATVNIDAGKVISTSGDYQKYFYDYNEFVNDSSNMTRYHHIIDPTTGYPVVTNVKSVSIITKQSKIAEIESTSLFIMDLEDAIEYVNSNDDIEAIWYLSDNIVVRSNGFANYE